ncbi:SDR family NAD(P)-dependent oxidoreductase [Caldilinea sp.]|jgi:short-subunit dehydrogenase|uniref:SDR family NAD(P)-dependent oxidoreductase n=1 Tax=Caldilinea sp. TaxID=2293560 RepID=UPI001B2574A4|nr:SDR family NAD(P)-dependent oxidoreductase [Caldilinea sp.]MBO9394514.1 SDR family NAD(P)-dependent oxidoreductase [Caldilinea sp.]
MMKHAVITGAAEGIGYALAMELGMHGYFITGIDVNAARAEEAHRTLAAQGIHLQFLLGDLGAKDDLDRLISVLIAGPPIDLLVHNAGVNCVGAFADSDLQEQRRVLDVNVRAPLQLTAALLRAGRIGSGGGLIFISSLSHFVSYPGAAVYAASKDALASYARSLSVALASQNIHVMTVYPGPTRTAHARRYSPDNRREAQRMAPERLAAIVYRAYDRRRHTVIPGWGNRFIAELGRWLPGLTEQMMKKTLFDKLTSAPR